MADVFVMAISNQDNDAYCIEFDELHGIEFPTISGVEGGGDVITSNYGIQASPTYILIAPDHSIVEQDMWPLNNGAQDLIDYFEGHGIQETSCDQTLAASFTSDLTELCEMNDINFSDASTGGATSWSWTFEGGDPATSDEQNPIVIYNTPGTYDVTLEVSDGTETNSVLMEDYITVLTCTGINEPDSEKLSIYPNPANGVFNLAIDYNGKISIKIVNLLGIVVYEQETVATGKFSKTIDLKGMENGIYIISIQTAEKTYVEKLKLED